MQGQFLRRCGAAFLLFVGLASEPPAAVQGPPDPSGGAILVENAWSPPTPPGAAVGAVYLTIRNTGQTADRLLTIDTPQAVHVAIHESHSDQGVMSMREVDSVACAPGALVTIAPGGVHLMLMGLTQPLVAGAMFPMTLHFRNAGSVTVDVSVKRQD